MITNTPLSRLLKVNDIVRFDWETISQLTSGRPINPQYDNHRTYKITAISDTCIEDKTCSQNNCPGFIKLVDTGSGKVVKTSVSCKKEDQIYTCYGAIGRHKTKPYRIHMLKLAKPSVQRPKDITLNHTKWVQRKMSK